MSCKCKRGACPECPSTCRRCGCACDGTPPEVALARTQGQRGKKKRPAAVANPRPTTGKPRPSKKLAQQKIIACVDLEQKVDKPPRNVDPAAELWDFFGWSQGTKSSLPSRKERAENMMLKESNKKGWSTIVRSVASAAHTVAEVVYPANPQLACDEACAKILGKDPKPLTRLETTLVTAYQAAPKGSVEKRALRAVLVKGISSKRIEEMRKEGRMTLGSTGQSSGYKDYKEILAGRKLEQTERKILVTIQPK